MNIDTIKTTLQTYLETLQQWVVSPSFYIQLGLIVVAIFIGFWLAKLGAAYLHRLGQSVRVGILTQWLGQLTKVDALLFPLIAIGLIGIALGVSESLLPDGQLLTIAQSLLLILFIYRLTGRYINNVPVSFILKWVIIPAMVLRLFGGLMPLLAYLEAVKVSLGNIEFSLLALTRAMILGTFLFWLGRASNIFGKQVIRRQESLDIGTREIFAKLFEILLISVFFILLLQVMGINLTTLAVFGGAIGVGLGFGLQSIASNFISGVIILLDRSVSVGDYVELEDGRQGSIRDLTMRSATVETFDGKDIVIPNETFISSSFTNWTHKNKRQRYTMEFQVAYDTDLNKLFPMLRELVASHEQVISGDDASQEEEPDVEIGGFGESGIELQIEFWMEGIDDGKNRVSADLYLMIWQAFRDQQIEIPYPQREVRFIQPEKVKG